MNKYILLLFLIPTLLLSKVDNFVVDANASKSRTGLSALMLLVSDMSNTIHSLQKERGASCGFISSDGEKFSSKLNATRKNSDLAISTLMKNVNINKNLLSEYLSDSEFVNLSRNNKELSIVRKDVDNLKIDFTFVYSKYSQLIALLFLNISDVSDKIKDEELSSLLHNYSILQLYEESIGQKRAILSALFSKKSFLQEIYEYYLTSDIQGNIYLKTFLHNSNENTKKLYDKKLKDASALELELELEKYEKLAYAVLNGKVVDINPLEWFDTVTKKINLIQDVEHELFNDILIAVDKLNYNQINLTKDEKNWLENHQVLKVGNEPDYAPWDFNKDGKPMGYSIDYINLLTSKLGIKVEYTLEPWDALVKKLTNKELDVLHTMFKNNNRKSVIYSDSYKKVITALFVHENNNEIKGLNDLATKTVSIPKNDSSIVSFKEQFPNTKISEPSGYLNAIKEVSLNKSDATILELGVANYLIKEYNIPNIKIVDEINLPTSAIDYSFRFGIRDDYAILVSILNKAMQSVSQNELDTLDKKWLNKNKKAQIKLSEEEKSWISEHKKIRFAGDPNWLPLEAFDENDKYIGIVSEYLKSIKEAAGINFEIIQTKNFDESISLAKAGDVDIISEFIDSELQKDLIFTNSYIANPLIIVMNEKANYVENLKDIKDKKIAVIKGYGYFSKLQKEYPNIQFENVDTIQDGLIAVSTSEIDAFVCTSMIGSYHISKMGLSNIKIVGKTKVITELGLGVRKDYALLVSIINKALANITKEEHSAIFGKWISVNVEQETRWTLILQIVGVGFLILIFLIYSNRKLKQLVDKKTSELQASLSSFDKNVVASKTDLNGIIVYASEAFCEISGYKLNEVIGTTHTIVRHPDMSSEVFADMWKTLKSGNIWQGEIKNLKKDGGFYWASTIAQPDYDSNGKHIGYSAICQNITSQKEVEELSVTLEQKVEVRTKELEESQLFLHTLIDLQEQIIITTQDHHITNVNKKFLDFYKVKEIEEFMEKYSSECICGTFNTAASHEYIQEMMDTQSWIDYVIENNKRVNKVMISQNGIDYIFSVNAANFPGHNGLKAAVFTDITDMEKATRAKSEFISNMSHEIRTPMNAVLGFTELLEETEVSTKQGSYIRSIKSGAKSLLTIINDILDLSKIEAGKLSLEYENNNMEELLQDIAQIFSINLQKKGLDFELNYDKKLPKTLIVDSGRIRQILFNLIGNAIKFTDKGFIKILVHASYSKKDDYIDLSISVADSGIGIAKDDYEKIFKSFEQQDGQSNRKYGGTGLGLTISNKLAKMMNGNITLESEVDKGSIFTLNLYDVEIGNKDITSKKEAKGVIEFDEATILIVDDIEENRKLIIENFLSSNLNFLEAEDGEEAVALALEKLPDLIIMDLKMPKMDGYEAMRKIKELSQDGAPPIIALTASVDTTKEHIGNEGFDGFLTKPITKQELVNELALFLKHTISVDESEGNNEKLESSYDIDITKTSPREVLEALSGDITDEFERVQFGGAFNDIEKFSNKLKEIAQKHNYDGLLLYAQKVDNAIEVFDIEKIDLLMSEYKEILNRIREMLDERV